MKDSREYARVGTHGPCVRQQPPMPQQITPRNTADARAVRPYMVTKPVFCKTGIS